MSATRQPATVPSAARCMALLQQLDAQVRHHVQPPTAAAKAPARPAAAAVTPRLARPATKRRSWIWPAALWVGVPGAAAAWFAIALPSTSAAPVPVTAPAPALPASAALAAAPPASMPASAPTAAMAYWAAAAALGLRDIEPAPFPEPTAKETSP